LNTSTDEQPTESDEKRGLIYARVSTEEQKRMGYSIASQLRCCLAKMMADHVDQVHEPIIESESGLTTKRDGLEMVFDLARQRLIDYLYTYALDRLGRNVAEGPYVLYRLRQLGVVVRTPNHEYDTDDPMQCVLAMLEFYPGHVESLKIGERTARGKVEKFLQGKSVGPIPFGYVRNAQGELEKVPEEVEVVRSVFKEYCGTGSLKQTLSIINSKYSSKYGSFSFDRIRRIVTNPIYVGRPRWGKHERYAPQLAMIDQDPFSKAQLLIDKNNRRKPCSRTGRNPRSVLDELTAQFDTGRITRFVPLLKPHCPHCRETQMHKNGRKVSKSGYILQNYRCSLCGRELTIPSERELDRLLAAWGCPRCGCTELDATLDPDGKDGWREFICRRCRLSFAVSAAGCDKIVVANERDTSNRNWSLAASREIVGIRRRSLNEGTMALQRASHIVHMLATLRLSLERSAFDYLKELKLETISESILRRLTEKALPGGIITKELLVELLSPRESRIGAH
jgi:site-specific DNA recombinase